MIISYIGLMEVIYKITNIVTQQCYIGSAINFQKRKIKHLHHLRKGNHHSLYLQNAWNKYGESNFLFEVITKCPKEYLIKLEQWFIDTLKPVYNMTNIAGKNINTGRKLSDEHRDRISKARKGSTIPKAQRIKMAEVKKKRVLQYDKVGNFIKEWPSMKEPEQTLGLYSISNACSGRNKTIGGFIWKKK